MKKHFKKPGKALFVTGLILLVILADVRLDHHSFHFFQAAKADDTGESACTFYEGFTMGDINGVTGATLTASMTAGASMQGPSGTVTLSGGTTVSYMQCCVNGTEHSACNFANEYGGANNSVSGTNCGNKAVRNSTSHLNPFCP